MAKGNNNFTYDDGIDLRDLFDAQMKNIHTLIDANDKNYNQRFDNINEVTKMALANADKATTKAEEATERRLEGLNEFRHALENQNQSFVTKSEFDARWDAITQDKKDRTSLIIAVLGIIISIVSLIIRFI